MPNTRERLIELLSQAQYLGGLEEKIADHLIANGVTFAEDINVLNKKVAELEKSNRNWRRKVQRMRNDSKR